MARYIRTHRLLLALLAACLLLASLIIANRWSVEAKNKTYDIVLDYEELCLLAGQSDKDIAWWLSFYKSLGISSVGLTEESLTSLMVNSPYEVTATVMDIVLQDASWDTQYPQPFIDAVEQHGYDRYDVLVEGCGKEAVDFLTHALSQRLPADKVLTYQQEDRVYLLLDGSVEDALYHSTSYTDTDGKSFTKRTSVVSSKLMYLSLGLLPEKVAQLQSAAMDIVPRTMGYNGHNDTAYARAVVADYEAYGITPAYLIAGGDAILGCDDGIDWVLDYVTENNITLGLIEQSTQRENLMQTGASALVAATDYHAVRVFSVWDYIQYRYGYYGYAGAEEIVNSLYRAVTERNIRLIYFKPVKYTDNNFEYVTDPAVYEELFRSLDERLSRHGFTLGTASVMENYQPSSLLLLAAGLAAGLGGALLPSLFLPIKRKWTYLLAAAAVVCVTGAWYVIPNTFRLLASFSSAVVFACLATAFFLRAAKGSPDTSLRSVLLCGSGILCASVLMAFAGGLMTAAPLSSTDFMLELGIFRGVKLAQLLPLAFFCLLFFSYYDIFQRDGHENTLRLRDVTAVLRWSPNLVSLLLVAVLGLAGYYYLARTGHETDVSISTVELMLRNRLEDWLIARPRTKEFLIAFPAVMLTVYSAAHRRPFWVALFGLAGTIGMTSVCNTFMHIRTPLYLGFARTGYSLLFGLILGAVYVTVFDFLCRLWDRYSMPTEK